MGGTKRGVVNRVGQLCGGIRQTHLLCDDACRTGHELHQTARPCRTEGVGVEFAFLPRQAIDEGAFHGRAAMCPCGHGVGRIGMFCQNDVAQHRVLGDAEREFLIAEIAREIGQGSHLGFVIQCAGEMEHHDPELILALHVFEDACGAHKLVVGKALARVLAGRGGCGQRQLSVTTSTCEGGLGKLAIESGGEGCSGCIVAVGLLVLACGGGGARGPVFGARLADGRRDASAQLAEMAISEISIVEILKRDPTRHEFGIGEIDALRHAVAGCDLVGLHIEAFGERLAGQDAPLDPPCFRPDKFMRLARCRQKQRQGGVFIAHAAFIAHLIVKEAGIGTECRRHLRKRGACLARPRHELDAGIGQCARFLPEKGRGGAGIAGALFP